MSEVGVWLAVVGLCDLIRAAKDATTGRRRGLMAGLGVSLLVFAALCLGLPGGRTLLLLAGWVPTFLLWLLGSTAALGRRDGIARALAFAGLGGGLAFGALAADLAAPVSRALPGVLGAVGTDLVVLGAGVVLVQLSTANVAVRLLLDAVGVPASTNEKKLKGGRLLGPMERLFIVGLALTGHVTAASVVVAAKGLLRFPELQRDAQAGPSDVTEYFLIGSFASWLLALGGAGLVLLGQAVT